MKKLLVIILAVLAVTACSTDDAYNLDYFTQKYGRPGNGEVVDTTDTTSVITEPDTLFLNIAYNGTSADISGDVEKVTINQKGADVTITSTTEKYLQLTLSGSTDDGSLLVHSQKAWGLVMNGVSITNLDGPAINNQCGKWLYVTLADSTENKLTDGESYAEQSFDQKGTFFSEGQIRFAGAGTLTVEGNAKNGIASDDYIVIDGGTITVNVEETGSNGIKVNDGFTMNDGTLNISVTADAARGIKSDARVTISGGAMTITTFGDCETEVVDGVPEHLVFNRTVGLRS